MYTRVLGLEGRRGDGSYDLHVGEAVTALREGKLVVFPTETVYGLGANADDPVAVARIYDVKQRAKEKQVSLLICSFDAVGLWVEEIPPKAKLLMDAFWPGPLTMVLPRRGGGKEVGLRFPDCEVALDIVRLAGVPVATTSANVSGMPPPVSAEQVMGGGLGRRVELVLDGGVTALQAPSTVVRVTGADEVEVIRAGFISSKEIYKYVV